jgi:hypothetical protein
MSKPPRPKRKGKASRPRSGRARTMERAVTRPRWREPMSRRLEIRGELDRRAAECLEIEIRQLAKRHGVIIKEIRIEPARPWPAARRRQVINLNRRRAKPPRRGSAR